MMLGLGLILTSVQHSGQRSRRRAVPAPAPVGPA
jgi:hypothetical protein